MTGVQQVSVGNSVVLAISAPSTVVPDVVGMGRNDAVATLAAAGLNAQVSFFVDDSRNSINTVNSPDPAGNTVAARGSTIGIAIGKAPKHPCP